MREHRHPHPHVDPRQPRHRSRPGTNPPVFVWKTIPQAKRFRLVVARDEAFGDVCLDERGLRDPMFLPTEAFAPGRYFWRWSGGRRRSQVFGFEITPAAVVLAIPPVREWLRRLPSGHPRIFIRPEDVPALRQSRHGERAALWQMLRARADRLLQAEHEIEEPPYLPDRWSNFREYFPIWRRAMVESRRFIREARTLALAYLASGDERYARPACQRMASISRWDPDGSSHIGHNDEAHMSVIWDGPQVCDWVWDAFTDEQRELVINQLRRRGQINFEHMHDRGMYGVERFDSHAGREIVFLAQIAFLLHEHVPEAARWLEWLRPVLCGLWPIWAGDDGGWAEGPMYGQAYVGIMTMFATTLKRAAGVDLYRRPFWRNHARWRRWCVPPYAEWLGFSDCGLRSSLRGNADLVEVIDRQTGANEMGDYVAACRDNAVPSPWDQPGVPPQRYLAAPANTAAAKTEPPGAGMLRVFPYVGWAAIRTHLDDPQRDVAFLFRSSPLGAVSHSHADNNDFILHVGGKVLAMPSGYYDGYGSDHHAHWVWHTKSANCVTLSDSGQRMRSRESRGAVEHPFEDDRVVYFRGNADASYDRARRCRRHVAFLKTSCCFVLIDEYVPAEDAEAALQWNVHSFNRFVANEANRSFLVERDGCSLEGHFLYRGNAFFSLSEGWDPPPMPRGDVGDWPPQYHLRFSITSLSGPKNLAVVLCPGHARLPRAQVATERAGGTEVARIGDDRVLVNQTGHVEYEGLRSQALAVVILAGQVYEVTDDGLRRR